MLYYTRGKRTDSCPIADWGKQATVDLKTYEDLEHDGKALDIVWDWKDVGSYPKVGERIGNETQKPYHFRKNNREYCY